jgi:serine/threonine protein kinase
VRADIYALAATLYALLTGRPPTFGADGRVPSLMTIMAMHDKPVDDVAGTPPEFMALLRRSLAPDPGVRPQTAAAFRDALLALPGPTTAPTTPSIAPAPHAPAPQAPGPASPDWETFAIAIMPAGAQTVDEPTLAESPTVRAVCSLPVLLDSRRVDARRIRASSWQIEVLPPTEAAYNSGARTYRCVADLTRKPGEHVPVPALGEPEAK